METIVGLFSETIVQYKTADLWDKAHSDYKDHKLKAVTWNNIKKSVELLGLCQILHAFSYVCGFDTYVRKVC